MTRYAKNTSVSGDRSRGEIEKVLTRYGADQFFYGRDDSGDKSIIGFRMKNRLVKFFLPMPSKSNPEFHNSPTGKRKRTAEKAYQAWEQSTRQCWRALLLVIKAKLEAVESGITEFESEFLAHIVMPDGKTIGEHAIPAIAPAYDSGKMPKLLPQFGGKNA